MIRYPITIKSLKKIEPKNEEEEIIANEEGEVLGRKGSVAKLSATFKNDKRPLSMRRLSFDRNSSNIPCRKHSMDSNKIEFLRKSSIPKPDYRVIESEKSNFTEQQAGVGDLLKLYDTSIQTKKNSNRITTDRSYYQNRNYNDRVEISNNNDQISERLKTRLKDNNNRIREFKRSEELNIYRDRKGSSDLTYKNRCLDNIATLVNDEVHTTQRGDVISKSSWFDYEEDKPKIDNIKYKSDDDNIIEKLPKESSEEEVRIENWEEIVTIPFTIENDCIQPQIPISSPNIRKNQNIINRKSSLSKEVFPDKESAFQHLMSLNDDQNNNIISNENKNDYSFNRTNLAEILSEYQQKGIVPTKEYNPTDFHIKRKEFFIANNIDTTSAARTIDVVTDCTYAVEDNANPYQNTFHVAKENPLYTNNYDWQDTIGKNRWRIN